MSNPSVTVHTDTDRRALAVLVAGPLIEVAHTELILADLDTLAPVVSADEQAVPLVSFAA